MQHYLGMTYFMLPKIEVLPELHGPLRKSIISCLHHVTRISSPYLHQSNAQPAAVSFISRAHTAKICHPRDNVCAPCCADSRAVFWLKICTLSSWRDEQLGSTRDGHLSFAHPRLFLLSLFSTPLSVTGLFINLLTLRDTALRQSFPFSCSYPLSILTFPPAFAAHLLPTLFVMSEFVAAHFAVSKD